MDILIDDVAKILALTTDEVMLLVQTNKIQARVQQEPLAWVFTLQEILTYKQLLESYKEV